MIEFSCGVIVCEGDIKALMHVVMAIRMRILPATSAELSVAKIATHGFVYGMQSTDIFEIYKNRA